MYIAKKAELDILKKGEDRFRGKTQNLFNQPKVFISTKQTLLKPRVRRPMGQQPKVQRRSSLRQSMGKRRSMGRRQWLGRRWRLEQQHKIQPWLVQVQICRKTKKKFRILKYVEKKCVMQISFFALKNFRKNIWWFFKNLP